MKKLLSRILTESFAFDSEGLDEIKGDIEVHYNLTRNVLDNIFKESLYINYYEILNNNLVERKFVYKCENGDCKNIKKLSNFSREDNISKKVIKKFYDLASGDIKKLLPR